jgi:uncharacterized phage protein (TIGR01671 family)
MREILFKAKRIDNSEWVEGYVVRKHGLYFIYSIVNSESCRQNNYEIIPETLCQFTGLCDKNGNKIWENDILMTHLDESYPENVTYETVEWNVAGWVGRETDSIGRQYLDKFDLEHYEVVGNIFDNPELLQEEHK